MLHALALAAMNRDAARDGMERKVESATKGWDGLERELRELSEAMAEAKLLETRMAELRSRINKLRESADAKISAIEKEWDGAAVDAPKFERRPVQRAGERDKPEPPRSASSTYAAHPMIRRGRR